MSLYLTKNIIFIVKHEKNTIDKLNKFLLWCGVFPATVRLMTIRLLELLKKYLFWIKKLFKLMFDENSMISKL